MSTPSEIQQESIHHLIICALKKHVCEELGCSNTATHWIPITNGPQKRCVKCIKTAAYQGSYRIKL